MRIVSLVPSATEVVCALGLRDALVGVSADCDYPPEIRGLPALSDPVAGPDLSSPAIDARIRARVHTGRSVYHLDAARLRELRPDLILTQEVCAVCAPTFGVVARAARMLEGAPRIVSLEPRGLEDVLETIRLVGELADVPDRAGALTAGLRRRIEAATASRAHGSNVMLARGEVRGRSHDVPTPRPRTVCLEWLDPLFVGGHWIPEMVALAGGEDVLGAPRAPSREAAWEEIAGARPEVLVVAACGFDIARTRAEIARLTGRPGWAALPAVRAGRVYLADGSAYFNRPGPRLVCGLEILAGIIQADAAPAQPAGAVERL